MGPSTVITGTRLVGVGAGGDDEPGWLRFSDGLIDAIGVGAAPSADLVVDGRGLITTPGLVDMHCHGGAGASFGAGSDAARIAAGMHLRSGTTTVMASLVSADRDELIQQVTALLPAVLDGTVCGIHLEGPWLGPEHRGAHRAAALRDPAPDEIASLLRAGQGHVRMVTLAPELDHGLAAVGRLVDAGVVVAVGHTGASEATTRAAIEAGARVATHLLNAMPPLSHREPGPVGVLLRDPRVVLELIADGTHVHPDVLAIVLAAAGRDRVALVTDALAATGRADGAYDLGGLSVTVIDGTARLTASGQLAGSTITLIEAVRLAVREAGWSLADAITCATATPARALALPDRGRLGPGLRADLVLLDRGLEVRGVLREGGWVVDPTGRN